MSGEQPPPPFFAVNPGSTHNADPLYDNDLCQNFAIENSYGGDDQDGWSGGVGKKRKIPINNLQSTSHPLNDQESTFTHGNMKRPATPDDLHSVDNDHPSSSSDDISPNDGTLVNGGGPLVRKKLRLSPARRLIQWKKELFVKRKANFITLYLDAQTALSQTGITNQPNQNQTKPINDTKIPVINNTKSAIIGESNGKINKSTRKTNFPDVSEFEKLLPALEDINISSWTPDRQGWKSNQPLLPTTWRIPIYKRSLEKKKKVERKGWFPEGSFEFELETKASTSLRSKAKEQSALLKLANELRSLIITANKTTSLVTTTTTTTSTSADIANEEDRLPSKTRRKLANKDTNIPTSTSTADPKEMSQPMSQRGNTNKKKPKKKKRSVLANQSNPHHVDNYRPSRTVSPHGDPYEPYASHMSLFNPPPIMFLATRPKRRVTNSNGEEVMMNMDIRPNEDDFICCFCEYDLYYSTEAQRKKAIRRRRKEIKRKELIKSKAKNVAEGEDEYDDEEDDDAFAGDDGDCHGDDGHGRCTCGRRVKKQKPDKDRDRDKDDG
ncbi:uncharacterized protein I206_105459 [Kwoniella pini CBS 10737]|uniref:Uncharacterized protein n=1 Tax=Kwoniella pini CBS 10737 TaxID=1296096 RepID=A0AAJ8L8Z0_9TREE